MSDREKLLGMVVGCLLGLLAVFSVYRMATGTINNRKAQIANRQTALDTEETKNLSAKRDQALVYEFQRRSLPESIETAHREFQHWLELQVKEAGLSNESVNFDRIPGTKDAIKQLSYTVNALGDIKQITQLLYRIHTADTLHRISTLVITKQDEPNVLKLHLRLDALSMPDLDEPKIDIGAVAESKLPHSLDHYEEKIASRNLFAPGNQPPELARLRTQEIELGKRWTFDVKATDPDDHGLSFQLGEAAPESAKISQSGTLRWNPDELGEYEFDIYVSDDGIPSKDAKATLVVKVVPATKPEEPEPELDESKLTMLTMIARGLDKKPHMCLHIRTKDELQYLYEGDRIKVGSWQGKVVSVIPSRNVIRFENDEGQFELRLGQSLSDAKLISEEIQ